MNRGGTSLKPCIDCGQDRPLENFYADPTTKAGLKAHCKDCHRERNRQWRNNNRQRKRDANKRWRDANPEKQRASEVRNAASRTAARRRWDEEHPEEGHARRAVSSALRRGELQRPDACEECGRRVRLNGHHDDYSKPLEVRWLCGSCHRLAHHPDLQVLGVWTGQGFAT